MSLIAQWYHPGPALECPDITLHRAAWDEHMQVDNRINRPTGTGDVLLMLFHQPCIIDGHNYPAWSLRCWPTLASQRYETVPHSDKLWHHSWIHMSGRLANRIAALLPLPLPLADPEPIQRHLRHAIHSAAVDRDAQVMGFAMHGLHRCLHQLTAADSTLPAAWRDLRQWMEQHSHHLTSIDDLATRMGLAHSQFHQRFVEYFHTSPMQYIQTLRLERARWLLHDHQRSVASIANDVGYSDVAYFSRLIRKRFGSSPRRLR